MPPPRAKTFQALKQLDNKGIIYHYTPFDQGAMVEILDPKWQGSCNALVHDWMLRKASQSEMTEPATYEITDPFIPHPVIVGSNNPQDEDIKAVQKQFARVAGEPKVQSKSYLPDLRSLDPTKTYNGIDRLVDYIGSAENHYGIIRGQIILTGGSQPAHVLAFVKRGPQVSFFDPNNGEITFNNLEDFRFWLQEEVLNGRLKLIGDTPTDKKYYMSDIFPQPIPNEEELNSNNKLVHAIATHRRDTHIARSKPEMEVLVIVGYEVTSYSSAIYRNPQLSGHEDEVNESLVVPEPLGPPPNIALPPYQLDSTGNCVIGVDLRIDGVYKFIALTPGGERHELLVHPNGEITDRLNQHPSETTTLAMASNIGALFNHFELVPPSNLNSSTITTQTPITTLNKAAFINFKEEFKKQSQFKEQPNSGDNYTKSNDDGSGPTIPKIR